MIDVLYLSQHLIILHIVHLVGTDLSFQCVLVEFATDVDQQRGRTGINVAAHRDVANVPRNMDAISQDHSNEYTWGEKRVKINRIQRGELINVSCL